MTMMGLNDTDIRLTDTWQLTRAADGDAPLCSGLDCVYQNIALEAVTQKGDLFYDDDFGWSLYDFIQSEDDDLVRLEIEQRARLGLEKREIVLPETIKISVSYDDGAFRLYCSWQFEGDSNTQELNVVIDAVSVEVVNDD